MAYIGVLSRHWLRGNEEIDVKRSLAIVGVPAKIRTESSPIQRHDQMGHTCETSLFNGNRHLHESSVSTADKIGQESTSIRWAGKHVPNRNRSNRNGTEAVSGVCIQTGQPRNRVSIPGRDNRYFSFPQRSDVARREASVWY